MPMQLKAGLHVALPRLTRVYGPIYKVFFGHLPFIVISDPDLVKEVRKLEARCDQCFQEGNAMFVDASPPDAVNRGQHASRTNMLTAPASQR